MNMLTDLSKHFKEVEDLWNAYHRKQNHRVPISFVCDEQVWLKVSGHNFYDFYTNPEIHLKVQLEGKRWFYNNIIGDMILDSTKPWEISVQLWMEENELFGAEIVYQKDDYAWGKPLPLDRDDLLYYLSDIDPEVRIRKSHAFKMYQAMKELSEKMFFDGRPVKIIPPGSSTHGIFTKAAEIRGLEQICIDLYEAPEFVEKFLHLVTEKTIARIKTWYKLTQGYEIKLPLAEGFHFADDSIQMISGELYERFILPCHEILYSTMTQGKRSIHLCGRSSQHYKILRTKLNVTTIDGPGPFIDFGKYLQEFGPEFSFVAATDHSVLAMGSEREIDDMMQKLPNPRTKISGRFQIVGFITRNTLLHNVQICYQYARKYGMI